MFKHNLSRWTKSNWGVFWKLRYAVRSHFKLRFSNKKSRLEIRFQSRLRVFQKLKLVYKFLGVRRSLFKLRFPVSSQVILFSNPQTGQTLPRTSLTPVRFLSWFHSQKWCGRKKKFETYIRFCWGSHGEERNNLISEKVSRNDPMSSSGPETLNTADRSSAYVTVCLYLLFRTRISLGHK